VNDDARLLTLFHDNRHLLVLTIVVSLLAGIAALRALPRLEDPRITTRNAIVVTPYPGASAERVEALVTEPLERALLEISEISELDSTSRAGISSIAIELEAAVEADTNEAVFSRIRDKLAEAASRLPSDALPPQFDDERGATAFTLIVALIDPQPGASRLGLLARHADDLADRLRNLPGTELVRIYGNTQEEIRVELDPTRSAHLGLSPAEVAAALAGADPKQPAGQLRSQQLRVLLEVAGELDGAARVSAVPVRAGADGSIVRVGDIAEVHRDWRRPPAQIARYNGTRAVFVAARMAPSERVDQWAERARARVADYAAGPGSALRIETVFDQSRYTGERLGMLTQNLLLGAGLVMLVVFVSMGWRAASAVGIALPMVAALSLLGILVAGGALHQMSIFGMIIALGLLIDNAIVVTDEVRRRRSRGDAPRQALAGTLRHLFAPLAASTLTTMLAFMPVLLLPGNAGDFVGWIGGSVVLAVGLSFAVAMTVVAALAARTIRPVTNGHWVERGIDLPALATLSRQLLLAGLKRPGLSMAAAATPALIGFVLATQLGSSFFPPVDRNMFDIKVWLPPSAAVERSDAMTARIDRLLAGHQEVQAVHWLSGNSFPSVYYNLVMNRDNQPNFAQGVVVTETASQVDRLVPRLQQALNAELPEARVVVEKFGQGPPSNAPVEYRLTGPEPSALVRLGERLRTALSEHPQVVQTQMTLTDGEPRLRLEADEPRVRLSGLVLGDLADALEHGLEGRIGGSVIEDRTELPVRVRYPDSARNDWAALAGFRLAGAGDSHIPLAALGAFRLEPEYGAITRYNTERANTVQAYTVAEALPIDVTFEVLEALDAEGFELPSGYRLTVAGEAEQNAEATGNLAIYAPLLLTLMIATLILVFRSVRIFVILMTVGGLSAGLGLAATWAIDFPISFNTILGTLGLIGVAFNNSIVVLAAILADPQARAGEVEAITAQALGTGRHLLSTTLTTIGGFLPLLIFTGGNFWPSLAIVLAGGVAGAMLLALYFTPAAYRLLNARERRS